MAKCIEPIHPIDKEPYTKGSDDDDHEDSMDWLDGHEALIIIFLLILIVIVVIIIVIIIVCKKKWLTINARQRMCVYEASRCHCYVNNAFNFDSQHPQCQGRPERYPCQNVKPDVHCNCQVLARNGYRDGNLTNLSPTTPIEYSNINHPTQSSQIQNSHSFLTSRNKSNETPLYATQNECQENTYTRYSPMESGLNNTPPDYSESENDPDDTRPMTIRNQDLFTNIPPQLLMVNDRSQTIIVQNKEVVYIARRVTNKGDNLVLDGMGISLFVPPGAVKLGEIKSIVLVLNWDLSDNPNMTEKEALVSPVVYVGPHDLKLEKQCILCFKHCSFDSRQIKVMKSETELIDSKEWLEHCTSDDKSGVCVLTPDECQLKIDTFTLYTCLQSPTGSEDCKKWLQVAAFSRPLRSDSNHQEVRLYFLNKTPCALQWATQNEAKFGGQMMGPEKVYLFYGNAQDMFISLRYLSDGWENVDKEVEERIPYINIWHGKCPHVTMCYRKHLYPRELTFKLFLFQYLLENEGGNFIAHMTEDRSNTGSESGKQEIVVTLPSVPNNLSDRKTQGRSNSEPQVHFHFNTQGVKLDKVERVTEDYYPHDLKVNLKLLLDPHCPFDKNWKALAVALGKERCIRYIETMHSPTECLLCHAESMKISLHTLVDILSSIQREDAADVVRDYIPHNKHASIVESASVYNIHQ